VGGNPDRRPIVQPLIDLGLFRSRSFSVGVVLAGAGIFGMFGVLFTLPQYLQAIMGVDAQGAGLRFLPMIAGLVVGASRPTVCGPNLGPSSRRAGVRNHDESGCSSAGGMTVSTATATSRRSAFIVGAGAGSGWPRPPRRRSSSCPRSGAASAGR
jgi:hypothetical protein